MIRALRERLLSPSGIRHAIDRAPLRSAASLGLGQISFGADYDRSVAALQDTLESNRRLLVIVDGDNRSIPQRRFDVSFKDWCYHIARPRNSAPCRPRWFPNESDNPARTLWGKETKV